MATHSPIHFNGTGLFLVFKLESLVVVGIPTPKTTSPQPTLVCDRMYRSGGRSPILNKRSVHLAEDVNRH